MGFTDQERKDYAKEQQAAKNEAEKERHQQQRDDEIERHNRAEERLKQAEQGDPVAMQYTAESLANATQDPSQLPKRGKGQVYEGMLAAANKYSWENYGKGFDAAQRQTNYKYANQKTTQDTLKMVNAIRDNNGSLDIAMRAAAGLPSMNEQTLNKVFNIAKTEFGDEKTTNFHTAMLGLADEYSKVMGGGTPTDTGRQQALDIMKDIFSKKQQQGAAYQMRADLDARSRALIGNNIYLQRQFNGEGGILATVVAPDGRKKEVPVNQVDWYKQNGARLATPQDK
jgi:hypothetical protein